jgi:hypothetical protein
MSLAINYRPEIMIPSPMVKYGRRKTMPAPVLELEGTWEEIVSHAPSLAGRRVRLVVLADEPEAESDRPPAFRPASGRSILRHAGTWAGDDLEECLADVYANRTKARF